MTTEDAAYANAFNATNQLEYMTTVHDLQSIL